MHGQYLQFPGPQDSHLRKHIVRTSFQGTGVFISEQGLVLTSLAQIQELLPDSLANDISFFAKKRSQEIPLDRYFIFRQTSEEEVSKQINQGIEKNASEEEQSKTISRNRINIRRSRKALRDHTVNLLAFNNGLQYFRMESRIFKDVRLVGFQKVDDIGFVLLRIYVDSEGNSAAYNTSNIPFSSQAVQFYRESIEKDSSVFSYGYPVKTDLYLPKKGLEIEHILKQKIGLQVDSLILSQLEEAKSIDSLERRLAKKQQVLASLEVDSILLYKELKELENLSDPAFAKAYLALDAFYDKMRPLQLNHLQASRTIVQLHLAKLVTLLTIKKRLFFGPYQSKEVETLEKILAQQTQEWTIKEDQKITSVLLPLYFQHTKAKNIHPDIIEQVRSVNKDYNLLAEILYSESILTNTDTLLYLVRNHPQELYDRLEKDIAFQFFSKIRDQENKVIIKTYRDKTNEIYSLKKNYLEAYLKLDHPTKYWEGNGTLRIENGTIIKTEASPFFYSNLLQNPGRLGSPVFNQKNELLGLQVGFENEDYIHSLHYDPSSQQTRHLSINAILQLLDQHPIGRAYLQEIQK